MYCCVAFEENALVKKLESKGELLQNDAISKINRFSRGNFYW